MAKQSGRIIPRTASAGGLDFQTNELAKRLLIEEGSTGILGTFGDPVALADRIERLMDDPDAAERTGRGLAQYIQQTVSVDRIARRWRDYHSSMGRKSENYRARSQASPRG